MALFTSFSFLLMIKADELVKDAMKRRFLIGMTIVGASIGIYTYLACYRLKTPWYKNDFYPPSDYLRGPIMRDQGNNI